MSSPAKVASCTCWAAIAPPTKRGQRWINYTYIGYTKRDVRDMLVHGFVDGSPRSRWAYWRKKGWTIERVTIQITEETNRA